MARRKALVTVSQATEHIYSLIVECQQHQENIIAAQHFANRNGVGDKATPDSRYVYNALMEKELSLWRTLAMSALYLPETDRDRIRAAVHERFFDNDRVIPTDWLGCDSSVFKAAIAELVLPKDVADEVTAVMTKRRLTHGNKT